VVTAVLGGVQRITDTQVASVELAVPVVQLQRALQVLVVTAVLADRDSLAHLHRRG
jgi:hypothetical protein